MAKLFVIIALMATFTASFGQKCGTPGVAMRPNRRYDPEGQRIVGGTEARPGSHPWIVSMQQYGSHFCGGTLIRVNDNKEQSDIVVTAAHCVYDGVSRLEIAAGAHDVDYPDKNQQKVKVSYSSTQVKYHPAYDPESTMNDIAIIKLDTPINFTSTIQPACLPKADEAVPDNAEAIVAGWGLTREGGASTSNVLMQVGVPTINTRECNAMYKKAGITIDSYAMICAGYKTGGKDACQGDSGGPFVVKNGDAFTLQGVVSFGVGCARPGMPGVYTRVSTYVGWLQTYVRILSSIARN
jgi:transmembrane serine protease 3